jgi:hypothetical protein
MISNSRMQITLLSFLFKKFNIIKKGINIKDTLKLYVVLSVLVVFHIRKGRRVLQVNYVKRSSFDFLTHLEFS